MREWRRRERRNLSILVAPNIVGFSIAKERRSSLAALLIHVVSFSDNIRGCTGQDKEEMASISHCCCRLLPMLLMHWTNPEYYLLKRLLLFYLRYFSNFFSAVTYLHSLTSSGCSYMLLSNWTRQNHTRVFMLLFSHLTLKMEFS